ncbi:DUF262 domain-containing protein [Clostridium manihotivorum]|nr:DUF262 domain-containing protein [Clostridium manihotivorum]
MNLVKAIDEETILQQQDSLIEKITGKRQEVKPDRADMTFGEIINMYSNNEIVISPEFQRAFRWEEERQTRFIESLLLSIPIPPIFVAETKEGVWELVDGLQRLSTVLSFFGQLKVKDKNNLVLTEGSLIKELKGFTIKTLPERYVLALKRAVCRVEIIRFDSDVEMRYELFNRLNTGGVKLSEQEIRNCIFRGFSNEFNAFIVDLSKRKEFEDNVAKKEDSRERMYLEELVLRYFTLKNYGTRYQHIQKHMDSYMLSVTKGEILFDYNEEEKIFMRVMKKINDLGSEVFRLETLPFSTSIYDPVMIAFSNNIDFIDKLSKEEIWAKLDEMKNDEEFRKQTKTSSSSRSRVVKKIEIANHIFSEIKEKRPKEIVKPKQLKLF